jgi:hypothetical protein
MPTPQLPQPAQVYVVGDTATITWTFAQPGTPPVTFPPAAVPPVLVDPGSVEVQVQPPGRQCPGLPAPTAPYTLTYGVDAALVRVAMGVYQATIPIGMGDVGRWRFRMRSTANGFMQGAGAGEWFFEVMGSAIRPPLTPI